MIIRISIPLLLITSTYFIFLYGFIFAGSAAVNEDNFKKAVALLANNAPPSLGYSVYKVLKTRAKTLTDFELARAAASIIRYSKLNGHDPFLLMAVIDIESNFRRDAVSKKGAIGFMQVRPFVARGLAHELDLSPDHAVRSLIDLDTNVRIGSYYLAKMKKRFGNLSLALEAYNLGPTRLNHYIRSGVKLKKNYTRRVLRSRDRIMSIAQNQI